MPALKGLFEGLGFGSVRTYLQSGNVIFRAPGGKAAELETALAAQIDQMLNLRLPVIVRAATEMETILNGNPFLKKDRNVDPLVLYVTFLQYIPQAAIVANLSAPPAAFPDEFVAAGMEVFLHCPNGYGRTKLNNAFFEKKLQTPATTRNWKTVTALVEMSSKCP